MEEKIKKVGGLETTKNWNNLKTAANVRYIQKISEDSKLVDNLKEKTKGFDLEGGIDQSLDRVYSREEGNQLIQDLAVKKQEAFNEAAKLRNNPNVPVKILPLAEIQTEGHSERRGVYLEKGKTVILGDDPFLGAKLSAMDHELGHKMQFDLMRNEELAERGGLKEDYNNFSYDQENYTTEDKEYYAASILERDTRKNERVTKKGLQNIMDIIVEKSVPEDKRGYVAISNPKQLSGDQSKKFMKGDINLDTTARDLDYLVLNKDKKFIKSLGKKDKKKLEEIMEAYKDLNTLEVGKNSKKIILENLGRDLDKLRVQNKKISEHFDGASKVQKGYEEMSEKKYLNDVEKNKSENIYDTTTQNKKFKGPGKNKKIGGKIPNSAVKKLKTIAGNADLIPKEHLLLTLEQIGFGLSTEDGQKLLVEAKKHPERKILYPETVNPEKKQVKKSLDKVFTSLSKQTSGEYKEVKKKLDDSLIAKLENNPEFKGLMKEKLTGDKEKIQKLFDIVEEAKYNSFKEVTGLDTPRANLTINDGGKLSLTQGGYANNNVETNTSPLASFLRSRKVNNEDILNTLIHELTHQDQDKLAKNKENPKIDNIKDEARLFNINGKLYIDGNLKDLGKYKRQPVEKEAFKTGDKLAKYLIKKVDKKNNLEKTVKAYKDLSKLDSVSKTRKNDEEVSVEDITIELDKKVLMSPEIAKESGYDDHLQRSIITSLGPKERIAIRSIPEGSTEMGKTIPFKGMESTETFGKGKDGIRVTNAGLFVSDADIAWVTKESETGRVLMPNEEVVDRLVPTLSENYIDGGHMNSPYLHGAHMNVELLLSKYGTQAFGGHDKDFFKAYYNEPVYIFSEEGYLGKGTMEDSLNKDAPDWRSTSNTGELRGNYKTKGFKITEGVATSRSYDLWKNKTKSDRNSAGYGHSSYKKLEDSYPDNK